jgi:uncharacterized repeat protein (TIGR02543 family)
MPAAPELTVIQAAGGTITLNPPGGVYTPNQVVQVTAVPNSGNSFVYWSGDVEGTGNPIDIVMDGHKTITAKFASYKHADIGTTYAGSTTESPSGISVTGSGSILWGENDSFRYTYKENLTGNGVFVAKITSWDGTLGNARAGIMVRQNTAVKTNYQGIFITGDKKIRSQFRNTTWTVAEYTSADPVTLPVWLKVEKQGTLLKSYSSTDGVNWVQRGSQTIAAFTEPYTVGLAVTAGQDTKFATAVFSDVQWPTAMYTLQTNATNGTVSASPTGPTYAEGTTVTLTATPDSGYVFAGWSGDLSGTANPASVAMSSNKSITANFVPITSTDLGTTYAGSTSLSGGNVTVTGSGANIWGQSDSFRYVHLSNLTGDATIVAKVNAFAVTGASANSNTKVGIMIRQSASANSAHQAIVIDGTKRVKSIYRDTAGGWAARNFDGTTVETLPIWLKLQKIGNVIKTYTSTDGSAWTERSSRTITFSGPFTVGLAVSSGTDSKFVEATFGDVAWPITP